MPESETDSKEPEVKFETKTDYESLLALNDVHLIQNVEQFECPVCFVDFDVGEGVTLQECLHSFCRYILNYLVLCLYILSYFYSFKGVF